MTVVDSCTGDAYIDAAKAFDGFFDGSQILCLVRHFQGDCHGAGAVVFKELTALGGCLLGMGGSQDDIGARFRQTFAHLQAKATRASGDKSGFSSEIV